MTNSFPANPIAAVTHADPYPYYANLVAETPLYRDESLGSWVATSAEAVTAVLAYALCRVRPVDEPIPKTLLGSPAAEIFRHLIRMNDGDGHCPFNRAVAATLASVPSTLRDARSKEWATRLVDTLDPTRDLSCVSEFAFQLSTHVLGSFLGVPDERLSEVSGWVGDFVRCVFPSSTPEQIERGKLAAGRLLKLFADIGASSQSGKEENLLIHLKRKAEHFGRADLKVILANGIGFLSQAYEATAGLISNALLALAVHDVRRQVWNDPLLVRELLLEVLRFDPPTHNTRRFLADDGIVLNQRMRAGDAILVIVAAANRDPALNRNPDRFDLLRGDRRLLTFGTGAHACPGDAFALAIAEAGVSTLIASGFNFDSLRGRLTYRQSANTRIPLFHN